MQFPHWCAGKTRYRNKSEAIRRIEHQERMRFRRRPKSWSGDQIMTAYRCQTCGQWHVGGATKKGKGGKHNGGPKSAKQSWKAYVPSLHTHSQEQAGPKPERQPRD